MSYLLRIMQLQDVPEILDYEQQKLAEQFPDEAERMIQSWKVKWRKEALEHYARLGWSFVARDEHHVTEKSPEGLLMGYFMAQPLLFFDGQTQTLWVEYLQYSSLKARDELAELAYKLAREKHLQKVLFLNENNVANSVAGFKPETWTTSVLSVKTTKAL